MKFFIISYVNSLERKKYDAVLLSWIQWKIKCLPAHYSYDLIVNSFGIAFAHVQNWLLMKKAHGTNRIVELSKHIDRFYSKTTQKGGFSKLCVKRKKKDVIPTYSIFQHVAVFPILSVFLTKYHYIILTDYLGIQFHRYVS